jgi:hypothetical protein
MNGHPDMRTVEGNGATKWCNGTFGEVHSVRLPQLNYRWDYVRKCDECGFLMPVENPNRTKKMKKYE